MATPLVFTEPSFDRARPPRILDVLSAVGRVAPQHPEIESWWYAPRRRMPLNGELPRRSSELLPLEIVVQSRSDTSASTCTNVAFELAAYLGEHVGVREHRGEAEERHLFRLLTRR